MNLMQGDCMEKMKEIKNNSVDMILCDIPYGTTQCKWDSILDLETMWLQLKRVIKQNGAILLFAQLPFDKVLAYSNMEMLRYEWIWEKSAATGHLNAKKMPMKAHENILVFYSNLPNYFPIKTTGHARKSSTVDRGKLKKDIYGGGDGITKYDSTERYPRTVLKFSSDKQLLSLHPTQKPVLLLEYLIKTYTREGETVLDFTMGSGSTGEACVNTNRDFIGIELDAGFFQIAKERILSKLEAKELKQIELIR